MIKRWKVTNVLIGLTVAGTALAQSMIEATPSLTSAIVSSAATSPFLITWTLKNNLSKPLQIRIADFGIKPADAFTVQNTTCDGVLPGKTCEMTIGIIGSNLQAAARPLSAFTLSPKFCALNDKVCSQPVANQRIHVQVDTTPSPHGQWSVLATVNPDTFPEFVLLNNLALTVGIINQNYSPAVISCPSIYSDENCMALTQGMLDTHFNSLTDLKHDDAGNLYGTFIEFRQDIINPAQTQIMKYSFTDGRWSTFGASFQGYAEALRPTPAGILVASGFLRSVLGFGYEGIGSARSYDFRGQLLNSKVNADAVMFNNIVRDGNGQAFVSGRMSNYLTPDRQANDKIWQWFPALNDPLNAFRAVNLPDNVATITDMVSDNQGNIYISGLDNAARGRVWVYSTNTRSFIDTGLDASYIATLVFSPYGYLIAAGINNTDYNGGIWFLSSAGWVDMQLPNAANVVAVAADANNNIVATGLNLLGEAAIWVRYP